MHTLIERDAREAIPWAHFRIPPFPQVAIQVLSVARNDGMSMCQISDIISSDPAFCSEVLTVANSAAVPHRFPVTSIEQAVAMLGTSALKGLCLTVAARAYLGQSMAIGSLRAVWKHSVATALIAHRLVLVGLIDDDTAYTAGLLHEIGRLALAVVNPRAYATLLDRHQGSPESILDFERELFGCDHYDLGQHLVTEWGLPAEFGAVAGGKNSTEAQKARLDLANLVHISCRMADAAGFSAFPGCESTPYEELLEELPKPERVRFYGDVKRLASEIGKEIGTLEPVDG